jgi:hypothetical protein
MMKSRPFYTESHNDGLSSLSLPGLSRQSMITADALFPPTVIMDAREPSAA